MAVRKLGVLLVHGIGMQRRGDTVLVAGDAIHRWLQRWFAGANRPVSIEMAEASLAASIESEDAAAHATLTLSQGTSPPAACVLSESRWADTFHEPGFSELMAWCFRVIPWAPVMYVFPRARRAWTLFDRISRVLRRSG